jgi:hypothetical protein
VGASVRVAVGGAVLEGIGVSDGIGVIVRVRVAVEVFEGVGVKVAVFVEVAVLVKVLIVKGVRDGIVVLELRGVRVITVGWYSVGVQV